MLLALWGVWVITIPLQRERGGNGGFGANFKMFCFDLMNGWTGCHRDVLRIIHTFGVSGGDAGLHLAGK